MSKTTGEFRVRTDFNVSGDSYVDQLKLKSAELIDLINIAAAKASYDDRQVKEFEALQELAMRSIEMGAMQAVKMATL